MNKFSFSERLRYKFDDLMSRGTSALILALFIATLLMVTIVALFTSLAHITPEGGEPLTFIEAAWLSLMRTLDPGTMGGDAGWAFRWSMLFVTVGGIFVVSMLIGILTTGLESKLEDMRKGRSFVIEEGHTVILGWSSQVFSIVSELVIANENQRRACIAILANKDKVEMEEEIHNRVSDLKTTRLVCRTGSPIDLNDLEIINHHAARAIIILAPETQDADTQTIKTMLAITNNPHRRQEPYHIVVEIRDPMNLEAARLVGKDEAELVRVDELIARITAQTCRQSGLSVIYTELLDFGGDEIYFHAEPALVGKPFKEALLAFEDSALMGLHHKNGHTQLLPPMQTIIQPDDQLIAISQDDDTIYLSGITNYKIDSSAIRNSQSPRRGPERTLILGWNRRAPSIIRELDSYVDPDSVVTIVCEDDNAQARFSCECDDLQNQQVTFKRGEITNRRVLDMLDIPSYNHVITLSASDLHNAEEADAHSLVTLLHLRDISERTGRAFSIVSEILDVRNRELAEVTHADDFIVSDKLVSLMMSQIAENKYLASVFEDLFDPEGAELYLKPASDYIALGQPVNF
jgi:voltage-gated potassium channel Kch